VSDSSSPDPKVIARERIETGRDMLLELSHRIHAAPELGYQEVRASGWVADALDRGGFAVERGAHDLPTALVARFGSGSLHVAVCAEYDALPEVGHACGHNMIAASAVGAGLGLATVADPLGLTVWVIGTPAEEGGGGKVFLLERGAFEGVHLAMMVHPGPVDMPTMNIIAASQFDARYTGKEAHASAFPDQGINAADALTVAQVALGLLRQHLRPTDRVHGITTKGGDVPNVIPAHTSARYMVRGQTLAEMDEVRAKVVRCFEAGALATGATLEIVDASVAYAEMRFDPELTAIYRANAEALGRSFPDLGEFGKRFTASTDMGNVSQVIPSIHPIIGVQSLPAANHQPEFAAHCVTEPADQAVVDGAVALAWTAIDAARDQAIRHRLIASGAGN
jgi:amidohydrolase